MCVCVGVGGWVRCRWVGLCACMGEKSGSGEVEKDQKVKQWGELGRMIHIHTFRLPGYSPKLIPIAVEQVEGVR